jgi:hypothetical protein
MATYCCKTSMAAPLGGTAGSFDSVHHRVLKMTSMVGSLGGTDGGSGIICHRV